MTPSSPELDIDAIEWIAMEMDVLAEQPDDVLEERYAEACGKAADRLRTLLAAVRERDIRAAEMGKALAFFASVIKSGEPWSTECQRMYDAARASAPRAEGET